MMREETLKLISAQIFLLSISFLIFIYLLQQCFIFSANYNIEMWRGVDDIAFQHTLLNYFPKLHGSFNDYGYGWLFWFSNALASYPGFILHHFFAYDRLLIVSPRLLSLILSFGGIYFFYRIFSFYCKKSWLTVCAVLLLLSYPTFGFYATYFGTAAHVFFYSILTMYFLLCTNITQWKNQKKLILAMAAAGAIKLTGLLIAPMVGLVFLDKNIRAGTLTTKLFLKLALFFLLALVFFINPKLYLSVVKPHYLQDYLTIIQTYLHQAATSQGDDQPWYLHAKNDLAQYSLSLPVFLISFLSLIIFSALQLKKRPEFFYIIMGYLISVTYLLCFVKEGGTYITLYAYSINWIPLLGLLLYSDLQLGYLISLILVMANLWLNHSLIIGVVAPNEPEPWLSYNAMSLLQERAAPGIQIQDHMKTLIQNTAQNIKADQIRILLVYPAPAAFSTFDPKYDITYMFDQSLVSSDKPFHYIILSLDSDLFDTKKIQKMDSDDAKKILKNHELLADLIKYKKFNAENCALLYRKEKIFLFQCNNL